MKDFTNPVMSKLQCSESSQKLSDIQRSRKIGPKNSRKDNQETMPGNDTNDRISRQGG